MTRLSDIVERGNLDELREKAGSTANPAELDDALRVAIRGGHHEAQRLLVDCGADVNFRRGHDGWRPLHSAVEYRQTDAIRFLAAAGADPNLGDATGATPLHLSVDLEADEAYQTGRTAETHLIELLLELGADPRIPDNSGNTPADWARDCEHQRAADLMS